MKQDTSLDDYLANMDALTDILGSKSGTDVWRLMKDDQKIKLQAYIKSQRAKLLQVIEDELNKFTARHDEPMKEAAIEIIKQIKESL